MKNQKLLRISAEHSVYKGWYNVRKDGKFTSKADEDIIVQMINEIYTESKLFDDALANGEWSTFKFHFDNGYSFTRKVAFWYFEQDTNTTYYLTFEKKGN